LNKPHTKTPYDPSVPKKVSIPYRVLRVIIRIVFPRMKTIGAENLPEESAVIVGNHSQMYGPVACELDFPILRYTWCEWEMMDRKEVPAYAFRDFWSHKPKSVRWLYRILSHLITPLAVCLFNNANTIPVYHDGRLTGTIRETIEKLEAGTSVVIFPETGWEPKNNILYPFQDRFIDVARFYRKKTGKELLFVPLYIAPYRREMIFGKPIRFSGDRPMDEERERIAAYLADEITRLAEERPLHTVVPYRNIPKKNYPKNRTETAVPAGTDRQSPKS